MCSVIFEWYCSWHKRTVALPLSAGRIRRRCFLDFRFFNTLRWWGWRLSFLGGGFSSKCEMLLAIDDCMPLGRLLMLGWILDEISADRSFMGVGVNLRPRLSTSISSLVRCSLDRFTTVVFFLEWGLVSLNGPAMLRDSCLGVRSMYWRKVW